MTIQEFADLVETHGIESAISFYIPSDEIDPGLDRAILLAQASLEFISDAIEEYLP